MRLLIQTLIQIREQQQKQPGYTAADLHPIILFMDELHALMPKVPDGMISTASGMFANLIAIGRSLGIWIVAASQRAGDIVEDAYKQPGINIALRVSNKEEREKVLSSAGIDTDSTRGQHMMRQAGTFPPGVGALAQPLNKVPLEVAFYSPEGTSTDPTQVLSAGVLTNERPPTRKQFRLAEKFFEDNDEVAQALKEWAAFICLTQAKDFRGNRLVLPGYEGMEPYMNVALDPKIIEFFLSKNPRQIQAILRMAASEAAGDRAVLLLNTINPGEAQTPDHIPNTKERMAEKIYRILHNSIYVHDQDQETHAPVPLLAAVPGETTASPYQYERGVYLLTQMLAEDPDRSQNIPIPIVAELKALHHLPPWLDETLSISAALERLLEHQRDAINKNSGVDGTGAWLFGRKAMAGGGWLESAVGVRWYDATFSDKLAVVIDKFVPDPKEARLLKKEFGHFIELRHRDRRIQSLKNARLALETWLAEYGKKTAQREVATETVRGAIREARRDAGIDEVVERVMVAMTTANAAVEIEREAGDTERDIIRDAVRQVIRETGGETARDAIRGAVIAEMRAAGKDVEDRPQRPDEYDAAYPHRYVFVNDGLELEGTTAYELLRSVYVQLSALEPQTKDPLSPAEREQVEAKKREAMERLAHV